MRCPFCSNTLKEIKSRDIIVDICSQCKGIWFDSGELAEFLRYFTEDSKNFSQSPQLFIERELRTSYSRKEKEKTCPRCSQRLHRFNYAYDSNVFLDKCPDCGGIWTDGDEVKEIIRYLKLDKRVRKTPEKSREPADNHKQKRQQLEGLTEEVKKLVETRKNEPKIQLIRADIAKTNQHLQDLNDLAEVGKFLNTRIPLHFVFLPKIILPLSDENPREKFPSVTLSIIILCSVIFIYQIFFISDLSTFFTKFGFVPNNYLSVGLISSVFLHGSLFHLLGNMYFLWIFGDNIEDRFGHFGYLFFYLLCGLAASVLHSAFNWNSLIPAIGASGAISGVMGAYYIFYPRVRIKVFVIYKILHIPTFVYLIVWFSIQLVFSLISLTGDTAGIAWFAHVGGFIFGGLIAYFKKRTVLTTKIA